MLYIRPTTACLFPYPDPYPWGSLTCLTDLLLESEMRCSQFSESMGCVLLFARACTITGTGQVPRSRFGLLTPENDEEGELLLLPVYVLVAAARG